MTVTYRNAPLVELIAEVRWTPGTQQRHDRPEQVVAFAQAKDEELFMNLAAILASREYGRFERVMPPGFPVPYGQAVVRFRPTDPSKQAPLFQMGHGVFSANALPPYKSWADFQPVVEQGLGAMLEAYRKAGMALPHFHTVVVRYIDVFKGDLLQGSDLASFLRDVMEINVSLPRVITDKAVGEIKPMLQLFVPTQLGPLQIAFAEAQQANEHGVLMDCSLTIQREMGSDAAAVVAAFTDARLVIHDLFRGLTRPLHDAMAPV